MNVPVATKETQGQRDNDFSHTREGEVVYFHALAELRKEYADE